MPVAKHHIAKAAVDSDKIVDASIKKADRLCSLSAEQTGTGSEQSIAHGLGVTPGLVMINITGSPATYAALAVTEGTHDATNVKVTVTSGWKYKVYAEA